MADINLTSLYFEIDASDAATKTHGSSGQILRALPPKVTADAQTHYALAATLPALTTNGGNLISTGPHLTGTMTLPRLTGIGYGGYGGDMTLPSLTGSGTGTIPVHASGAMRLPMVTLSGHILTGSIFSFAITLPKLGGSGRTGLNFGRLTLPKLQGSGTAHNELHLSTASTSGRLPTLRGAGSITNAQGWLHGNIILPAVQGISGTLDADMRLPALVGQGGITNGTAATQQAWVTNVKHSAVSRFTNFGFRVMARAFDQYWGVGLSGGFYKLGVVDTDNGTVISWEWRTGLSDLDSRALKGVQALYFDGVAEKGCDLVVQTDHDTYIYYHHPAGSGNDHKPQRITIGRGLRSVNLAVGMRSTVGAYMQADSLTPEYVLTNRRM